MADIKLSALPSATPGSGDSVVGLQGGVAFLLSVSGIVGITLPANASPLDTDQIMERTLAAPNSPKTLTIARLRNQVAAGAAAAATLALADTVLSAQSGAGVGATVQQVLDAYGLAANDATPADADKLAVNQGGVAATLTVSALRTQLDAFASARTIQATAISPSAGSAVQVGTLLQLGGTTASFAALKRNGTTVQCRTADDSADVEVQAALFRCPSTSPQVALNRGTGSKAIGVAMSSNRGLAWTSGADSESGFDVELDRITTNVLGLTNGSTGGAAFQFKQMTAPAGASATARLYAQDNGSGKTQLMVIFPTGAAIQLAIEA